MHAHSAYSGVPIQRTQPPQLCLETHHRRLCPPSPPGAGELDQTQFLLGHVSIQTTERYLGCKQKLRYAVNDMLAIEPECAT